MSAVTDAIKALRFVTSAKARVEFAPWGKHWWLSQPGNAPVVDAHGTTIAALHCHGPSYRFPGDADVDTIAAHVNVAARKLGGMLS